MKKNKKQEIVEIEAEEVKVKKPYAGLVTKSICFNTAANKIVVTFIDDTQMEYFDKESYLEDFKRHEDVKAMGCE